MRQLSRPDEPLPVEAEYAAFVLDAFGAADFELELATGVLRHSPRLNALYGYPPERLLTVADCLARHHPDDRLPGGSVFASILAGGGPGFHEEFRIALPDGAVRWVLSRGEIRLDAAGRPALVRGVAIDITERKRQEASTAFLAEIMADFAPLKTAEDIMRLASTKTAAHFGLSRCVLVEINEAADEARVIYDYCEHDMPSLVGLYRLVDFHTDEERRELGAGNAIVVRNVADETRSPEAAERFRLLGIGALVNASYVGNGRWQFVLSAMQAQPRDWHPAEVTLLQELSARIWPRIARARAEEALRESEERYRTLIDSIDQAFCLVEILHGPAWTPADYRFLKVNKTFERHTGLSEVVGRTIREIIPDLEPHWVEILARVALSGEPARFEERAEALGRWFEVEAVRVGAANLCQVAAIFTDITARKQAEADARFLSDVSEQLRVREDAEQLVNAVARLLGPHLRATRCFFAALDEAADRWEVRHEYSVAGAPPLAGLRRLSAFPPILIEALRAGQRVQSDDVATDERSAALYDEVFQPLGIEAFAVVRLRHERGLLDALAVTSDTPRDWTARELSLLETVAERTWNAVERLRLMASQRAYAARLQQLNAASLLLNAAPSGEAVLRLTAEEARSLVGAHLALTSASAGEGKAEAINEISLSAKYACWHGRAAPSYGCSIYEQVSRTNAPVRLTQAELEAHAAWSSFAEGTGSHPPLRGLLAVTMVGRDGRTIGLIQLSDKLEGEFTDDDEALLVQLAQVAAVALENRQLYAKEQAARAEAEEASRLKDEFLATVSHELRTPLTAFLGYVQLLQRRRRDEAYVARTVELMMQSAKAQALLIEDLLDVSRIVSGKLRIELRRAALTDVVHAALDTVRPMVEAKGLRVQVEVDPAARAVFGDADRLQQVVWNLLSNAAKFTPPGGLITVRLARAEGCAELSVRDTGQGIRQDFLPYVFDRFRQGDSSSHRSHGGLGLGLAIVRHLVELHGGAVEAASDGPGYGATFTVRLPLLEEAAQPAGELVSPAEGDDDGPRPLAGLRVLVVDDQPAILELVGELLAADGAEVLACPTAREALAQLRAWRPDVLVSDIAMPDEDGYWLIRQVRRFAPDAVALTPAVALTAYVRIEDRLRVLEAGFQQYVPKPLDPVELRDVVLRLVAAGTRQ